MITMQEEAVIMVLVVMLKLSTVKFVKVDHSEVPKFVQNITDDQHVKVSLMHCVWKHTLKWYSIYWGV